MASIEACEAQKDGLLEHRGEEPLLTRLAQRHNHRKLLAYCGLFVALVLFLTTAGKSTISTQLIGAHQADRAKNRQASCVRTLESQSQMLVKDYAKILEGVTHIALIAVPIHSNKGDSAIWIGEDLILQKLGVETVYACADNAFCDNEKIRASLESHGGPNNTAIVLHGGGNFGDIWHFEQQVRERVVMAFPDYKIRAFPQTYKFNDPAKLKQAQDIFHAHPNLELAARDTQSFIKMQRDFGKSHKIVLLPDPATMLLHHPLVNRPPNKTDIDFLYMARTDGEGGQKHQQSPIFEQLHSLHDGHDNTKTTKSIQLDWTDTDPEGVDQVDDYNKALMRVEWTYDFLGQGALVISDRLHAHILSTVWGFDHVTLEEGTYGKLTNYHDTWLSDCSNKVVMTQGVQEAVNAAKTWYNNGKMFVIHS